ncbi:phosphatase PAP2 family protein [Promicromonospora aerolata]|uniref:Phosphatase PAP2 family protein n=1 Tax=Promicromonospora aerolata TaxID=195749 RepID=A0ABW4VB74_9MICO
MPVSDGRRASLAGSRTGPDPTAPPRPTVRRTTRAAGFVVALGAAAGTWLVWWAMVTTWPGQRLEERVFDTADRFQDVVNPLVEPVLLLGSLPWLLMGLGLVCGIGLLRRRWRAAAMAAVVIIGSNVTTQVVKDGVFDRTGLVGEWNRDVNTLPSGHVTVVVAAWAALLLVTPRGWRPLAAFAGAVASGAIGLATLGDRWHRPSDVVAAVLVVVACTALVCAVAPARWADRPGDDPAARAAVSTRLVTTALWVLAVPTAGLSVLAAAATEGHTWTGLPWAGGLTAYTAGLLAACAISATAFAVLLPLCQATARPWPSGRREPVPGPDGRASLPMSVPRHKVPTEPP